MAWVTTTIVRPSRARSAITARTSSVILGSRALVGSSKRIARGSIARARAIATRCCWPPGELPGAGVELVEQADPVEEPPGPLLGLGAGRGPRTWIGPSVTFSRTVRCGNRLNPWKTIPTRRQTWRRVLDRSRAAVVGVEPEAVDGHRPALERLQAVEAAEERALAAARRADDRRDLAPGDPERDPPEDFQRPVPLDQAVDLDHPITPFLGSASIRRSTHRENHDSGRLIAM